MSKALAQAVWEAVSRTLVSGTPDAPTNRSEEFAKSVWESATRTLTSAALAMSQDAAAANVDYDSADLSVSAATGGTAPYTYQWYRDTSTPVTPGAGNLLSGKTSLSFTDSELDAETDYYYVCRATDDAAATDDSNEVHVTTTAIPNVVSVTTPVAWKTYQRNGSDEADIAITGTYTGTPTAIEASFNGGAYATIDAVPAAGAFSGTLSAQAAGQGTLTVRFTNEVGVTDTVASVGIGDVFLIIGDSISEGWGQNAQVDAHATLQAAAFNQSDTWQEGNDPIDSVRYGGAPGYSHWPLLARWIETDQSVPVAFVTCGTGATDVYGSGDNEWAKPNSAYTEMQAQAAAYGGTFKAVLAHLGPNAIVNATTPSQANYNAALDTLASNIQADIQASLPLFLGLCGEVNTGSPPDRTAAMDNVRNAIVQAWDDNASIKPGLVLVDQDYGDNVHPYTDAQLQQLAARWWAAISEALYGGASGRGPRIASATYTGPIITLLFDSDLASATAYTATAFTVTDGSGARTVNGATKVGARRVMLDITGDDLSGSVSVVYASANTASGATVPTRAYTMPDSSSAALPAEPFVQAASAAGGGYTYGDEDPTQVLTTADGAGTLDLSLYTLTSTIPSDAAIAQAVWERAERTLTG